jgi:hypothetical protein
MTGSGSSSEAMASPGRGSTLGHPGRQARYIRVPGFVAERDVGLGDLIGLATRMAGVAPCRGCAERAARLNRAIVMGPTRRQPR